MERVGKTFFLVRPGYDGTADILLMPNGSPELICGRYCTLIVRGVVPFEGIEANIRAHYEDWLRIAEVAEL